MLCISQALQQCPNNLQKTINNTFYVNNNRTFNEVVVYGPITVL